MESILSNVLFIGLGLFILVTSFVPLKILRADEVTDPIHVYLNGQDVSKDCSWALVGWVYGWYCLGAVRLSVRDEKGELMLNTAKDDIQTKLKFGLVRWTE